VYEKFQQHQPQSIVFCDFDGTITAIETFVGMLKEFAPELSAQLLPEMYARRLTLREGVKQLLESIPSDRYPEIISYAASNPIRPGLEELINFLNVRGVPFIVISGGLRDMVETVLDRQQLIEKVDSIYAVDIDTRSDRLQVHSDFEGNTELVAKVKVMEQYFISEKIAIGDSVTDINMALAADLVFARDRLVDYLEAENKPYIPWNDFLDIRDYLAHRWQIDFGN
jgi:2-hydroxy-3-keto-5-methylthiopentenyl-1-phosphate phosphatase